MSNVNVAKFADDLSIFKQLDKITPLENDITERSRCRSRMHVWGRAHRVAFDANKKHLAVLYPTALA